MTQFGRNFFFRIETEVWTHENGPLLDIRNWTTSSSPLLDHHCQMAIIAMESVCTLLTLIFAGRKYIVELISKISKPNIACNPIVINYLDMKNSNLNPIDKIRKKL